MSKLGSNPAFAFVLFVVLVWIAVDLGHLLAELVPQLPPAVRGVMSPEVQRKREQDSHF